MKNIKNWDHFNEDYHHIFEDFVVDDDLLSKLKKTIRVLTSIL